MERRFSLESGRGWLTVRDSQGHAECKGELPDNKKGLYKGWLVGPGGKVLLGAFVPEQGALRLSRTMSIAELERQGAWPPTGGEAVLAYAVRREREKPSLPAGWSRIAEPARLMGEPLLARAWEGGEALFCKDEQGFLLARRFRTDRPFPLTPLFCFAQIRELDGAPYVVFPFRPGGCPRLE